MTNTIRIQATENSNTLENSRQLHEQANKKKKARTHKFNEVQQLPMSSGQKGREILLINQLQYTINRGNTPIYIARNP